MIWPDHPRRFDYEIWSVTLYVTSQCVDTCRWLTAVLCIQRISVACVLPVMRGKGAESGHVVVTTAHADNFVLKLVDVIASASNALS